MGGFASVPADPSRRVQVISAGYSRTGTVSMSLALGKLLDGPALHGGTQLMEREDGYSKTWVKAFAAKTAGDRETTLKHLRNLTAGFVAVADGPPIHFIPELLELYPDAKVVLVRRDPQRWWASFMGPVNKGKPWWYGIIFLPIPGWRHLKSVTDELSRSALRLAGVTDAEMGDLLELHNNMVRSLVPRGQLLEMDISEGWEPLCKFLGVPVPDEPFPRANDAKALEEYAKKVIRKALGVWVGIISVAGVTIYSGVWLWRNK
ncbi:hypothetical protein AJ79_00359 [Helicocarpus griseus UAMH5409]|uniref:NAD dependent epimerase/dehydratase n=1 Tax=Helicocarpus griseus UAMH5409 TaxID=1447875 RepID=A0A2B7YBK6_9EURO|nr:hypothetical protein AJ79_00359 [Helicocarpus griseus UAMH5409]